MKNMVSKTPDLVFIRHALISLSDKTGLEVLVRGLLEINPEIRLFSTGGTYDAIKQILISTHGSDTSNLIKVSEFTGQPEMQGGLVKTLDFKIYLGLLAEAYNTDHQSDLNRTGAIYFDLVVVNLYPFKKTITANPDNLEAARGNIDIGGPTMLRSSAKNFLRVTSLCQPSDYSDFLRILRKQNGCTSLADRLSFAQKTFNHTAQYEADITEYFSNRMKNDLAMYQQTTTWEERINGK